jgi:DNA modification methylase
MNTLYYGDNLTILANHVADESVDLVYLDPPFNSNRDYNVLFREQSGSESPAQIQAFGDTWNWAGAAEAWQDFPNLCPVPKLIEMMHGFRNAIGENDVMAYLVMMAPRLYHLHRVLKPTGSLYLHCDPTASHYLKLILDCIFSPKNFKNEVIWKRTSAHSSAKRYGPVHDVILYYSKSPVFTWNEIYLPYSDNYMDEFYTHVDERGRRWRRSDLTGAGTRNGETGQVWRGIDVTMKGRHWAYPPSVLETMDAEGKIHWPEKQGGVPMFKRFAEEQKGIPLQDIFDDIRPMHNLSAERLGYPTQKPLALLERIITASSNEGDVVLDPFCGCGTAVVAAQTLGRSWIGIDITPIATTLVQKRLYDAFGAKDARLLGPNDNPERAFRVEGLPTDIAGAKAMFEADHKKFEMWAVGLVPAIPQEKKGADAGIDGMAYFQDNPKKPSKAVVQVKGGHLTLANIRDLRGVKDREKAALAFFVTLEKPTKPMMDEARSLGYYQPPSGVGRRVEAFQIRTIEELLNGKDFDFPVYGSNVTFQQAPGEAARQAALEF